MCRVGSDGRSGIPNVEQPQLFKRDDISLKNPRMHSNESVNPARTSTPIIVNSGADESQLARDTTVTMNESLHAQQNYCNQPGFRAVGTVNQKSKMPIAPRECSVRDCMYGREAAGSSAQTAAKPVNPLFPNTTWSMTQIDYNNLKAQREFSRVTVSEFGRGFDEEPSNKLRHDSAHN